MRAYRERKRIEEGRWSREEYLASIRSTPEQVERAKEKVRARARERDRRLRTELIVKKRSKPEEQRERDRQTSLAWKKKNRDRVQGYYREKVIGTPQKSARDKVYYAVKTGKLTKPSACERCGVKATGRRLHAHHDDYEKPLEVEWLCTRCHGTERRVLL